MTDHHPEISEGRLFFFEKQEIVVENIDASGYILDIGGSEEGIIGRLKGEQVIAIDPNRRELEGLMPIHIRYGDKNSFLSQQLDISPVAPTVMRYWQASYAAIVVVFGVLCGSI